MAKYLVTGIKSGLGKYLYENLSDVCGLDREGFNSIKNEKYDIIIHCAFNKSLEIKDYYSYLEDNILLTQKLLTLNYKKFIYISTIDVYSSVLNMYGLFKTFAESMVKQYKETIILRCSLLLGKNSKPNHITKLINNIDKLSLSDESIFNYITYKDVIEFINLYSYVCPKGIYDFVANNNIKLSDTKNIIISDTKSGNYIYQSPDSYPNPIYNIYKEFNNSSENNLNKYLNEN